MRRARVVLTRVQLLALALMLERGMCWSELSDVVKRDAGAARPSILRALSRAAVPASAVKRRRAARASAR